MNPVTPKAGSGKQRLTLEQQRAQYVWDCVKEGVGKDYVRVAKATPQLIMNSGLMQTLAFMHQKGGAHEKLARQLRIWLNLRFKGDASDPGFERTMEALLSAAPVDFRLHTAEALAWLKWLRQFAAAKEQS